MTYAAQSQKYGKQAVQIVELYLDTCSLTYGVAPCTGAIGVTGTQKCFNTRATCQSAANYARTSKVYRFSTTRVDGIQQPGDGPTFPTLLSVKSAPTVLTPGKGLGIRSSLSISIADHPWTDSGIDKYQGTRGYDADLRGSFWGKFVTRNRYYENRRIDVLTGFLNDDGSYDVANFKRRTYIITKISGPTGGNVSIEAKDPLRLADGEKAKWPKASQAILSVPVDELATSISITDPEQSITEWWNLGQRYIRCEDEIMRATGIAGLATTTPVLTVVRGSMPTWYNFSLNIAYPHELDASLQPCHLFDDAPVYDIVYFLLNSVAGIDPVYLPLSEWTAAIEDEGFQYLRFNALLIEPVDVKTLLTEITELSVLIWWDERSSVVRLKGLRFVELIGDQFNDSNAIVSESVSVSEDTGSLMTQHWLFFDLSWPLANMSQLKNYRVVDVRANLEKEGADQYGKAAIAQKKTRWLNRGDAGVAMEVGFTMLKQYQEVRKIITWTMDPKDDAFWVGSTVGVATKYVQDQYGSSEPRNYLVTQVEEIMSNGGVKLKYTGLELFSFIRTGLITHPSTFQGDPPDPIPAPANYSSASALEKSKWAYICYDDRGDGQPGFLDGTGPYQIV
jgi:hypothetical protein